MITVVSLSTRECPTVAIARDRSASARLDP
jgi:hypothetical protein